MGAPAEVQALVDKFDRQKPANETELRRNFVDPLFTELGWDVTDNTQVGHEVSVLVNDDGTRKPKRPDYGFRIGGEIRFFVETKPFHINLKSNPLPAFQLRRYGWSGNAPVSVLTDFEEFSVYDCRVQPQRSDPASKARLRYFQYGEYIDQWDELESRFSREAVANGALREWVEGKRVRGLFSVDQAFLREMESWREILAREIALHNRDLSQRQLNLLVQRTIDRIVFLRIAEDRNIELYGRLRSAAADGKQVYEELKILFNEADDKYNSGLFHFGNEERASEPDRDSLRIHIPDDALRRIIRNLYFPYSPYEFSVLPADILGQVYEQFLGKVIELSSGGAVRVDEKPEVRKAGGVYYTPAYIVDYIVENTVGALLKDKTPEDAEKLRILDPACGSGSFLTGAYQYLLDWHLKFYSEHKSRYRNRTREIAGAGMILTTAEKRRILLNNIYGVDLDQNAVEVSKLSLLLKMLENESEAAGTQTLMFSAGGRILPDLSGNIKWGNSLIGSDFYRGKQPWLFDNEELNRVKAFDWDKKDGFAAIMTEGGFDAVIGNPPYVRQEILGKEFKDYAKGKFETYVSTADLYLYFVEKSHALLRHDGLYGVIVSNKFMRAKYGTKLRKLLSTSSRLLKIIDFGELPVFKDSATFPAILLTQNSTIDSQQFIYAPIKSLSFTSLSNEIETVGSALSENAIKNENWTLVTERELHLLEKIQKVGMALDSYLGVDIHWGIKTGLNEAFVVNQETRDRLINEHPSSKELLAPFAVGDDIRAYRINDRNRYVVFIPDGWTDLRRDKQEAWAWFTATYPAISGHLALHETKARKRYDQGRYWWELRPCEYYHEFFSPKLVYPEIAKESRFTFDETGILTNNKTYIIETADKYLLGILNSKLIWTFLKRTCSVLGDPDKGGRLELRTIYMRTVPIRPIDFDNPADVQMHNEMVKLVDEMLERHRQLPGSTGEGRRLTERLIETVDEEIDALVYRLYGLSEDEVRVVEGG